MGEQVVRIVVETYGQVGIMVKNGEVSGDQGKKQNGLVLKLDFEKAYMTKLIGTSCNKP